MTMAREINFRFNLSAFNTGNCICSAINLCSCEELILANELNSLNYHFIVHHVINHNMGRGVNYSVLM